MKKFIPLAFVALAACTPAPDSETVATPDNQPIPYVTAGTYSCTPSSFTLDQKDVLDTGAYYELNGTIDMPTPGYSYVIEERPSEKFDQQNFSVYFQKPSGMALQVITPMEINYSFPGSPVLQRAVFMRHDSPAEESLLAECMRD